MIEMLLIYLTSVETDQDIFAINLHHLHYKMAESKIYLNVPFAQKDEAKALGARWDAVQKKWFVPTDKDIALFARWYAETGAVLSQRSKTSSAKIGSSSKSTTATAGVKTHATAKDFVAYNSNKPPWN